VRHLVIQASVLEINGKAVVSTNVIQQSIDVINSSIIIHGIPESMDTSDPRYVPCSKHHRFSALWRRLPHGVRVAIAAFFGTAFLLVFFIGIPVAIYMQLKQRRISYNRLLVVPVDIETAPSEAPVMTGKDGYESLPAYESEPTQ